MSRLSVALVTYRTEASMLARTLDSLARAVQEARAAGLMDECHVSVIDNGPEGERARTADVLRAWPPETGAIELLQGHGNVGYGRANNLVLERLRSDVHLILNPDVEIAAHALAAALRALIEHPEVGLVAPAVFDERGERQYLCKRFPSAWVLFLRGFAPRALRERFRRTLAEYEMRDAIGERFLAGVPLASGCFMLVRTELFRRLGGFDPRFFLYFEDYDLSLRIGREASIAYVPEARIVHHGGEASRKGWRHVAWFVRSASRFYARHGWKLF